MEIEDFMNISNRTKNYERNNNINKKKTASLSSNERKLIFVDVVSFIELVAAQQLD